MIATGLNGADDPIWIPDIGLLFSEPNADRIVRLSDAGTVLPFLTGLHRPLGMTFDGQGRLISLQSEAGFTSVRVVWPPGKEAVLAERFDGLPFSRPNGVTVDRKGGVYFSDPGLNPAQEAAASKDAGSTASGGVLRPARRGDQSVLPKALPAPTAFT